MTNKLSLNKKFNHIVKLVSLVGIISFVNIAGVVNVAFADSQQTTAGICRKLSLVETLAEAQLKGIEEFNHAFKIDHFSEDFADSHIDNIGYRHETYTPEGQGINKGHHISSYFKWLKEVNDYVNKVFGTSSENLFKQILFTEVEMDRKLIRRLRATYYDYKSLRYAFRTLNKAQRLRLENAIINSIDRFNTVIANNAEIQSMLRQHGDLPPAHHWHGFGIGPGPDQANFAARNALDMASGRPIARYKDAKVFGNKKLAELDVLAGKIFSGDKLNSKMFTLDEGTGQHYFSFRACEILRKEAFARKVDYEKIQRRFQKRFQVELTDSEVRDVVDYYVTADRFSPELVLSERVTLDFGQEAGVISIDLVGMGAQNAEALLRYIRGLLNTDQAIIEARQSEMNVTRQLDTKVDFVSEVLRVFDLVGETTLAPRSGDDIVISIKNPLNKETRQQTFRDIIEMIAMNEEHRASYRIVDIDGTFVDAKARLGAVLINKHIVDMENVLKRMMLTLEAKDLYEESLQVVIAGEVLPGNRGDATYNLVVGGELPANLTQEIIRDTFQEAVRYVAPKAQVKGDKSAGQITYTHHIVPEPVK